jgi:hypothetical protein
VQARPLAAAEALETAAHDRNWGVDWIRRYPDYARLLVTTEHASLLVDLALETVELPPATTVVGPTIAEQEVAVGKLIALFDRAEARDFVDVLEFCQRYEPALLLELAVRRDAGLGPRTSPNGCAGSPSSSPKPICPPPTRTVSRRSAASTLAGG